MEHRCGRCGVVLTSIDATCATCGAELARPKTDTLELPSSARRSPAGGSSEFPSGFTLTERELADTRTGKTPPLPPDEAAPLPVTDSLDDDPLLLPVPKTAGGKVLGGVRLVRRLGSGGMGAVYAGQHLTLDMTVAVKILLAHHAKDSDYAERFVREAQVSARIDHHNLVRTLHAGQENGVLYIQMEFIDGMSAAELLRRKGPLPEGEAIRVVLDATRGLAEAHRRGVVHRDVKPDNILVRREDGRAKLADLGLARAFQGPSTPSLTGTGMALGTPLYMAPEQIEAASMVGPPADVYSMGATLYELVCGKPPFSAPTIASLFREILTLPAPDPALARPGISPVLRELILRALDKEPARRYASAEDLEKALEQALAVCSSSDLAPSPREAAGGPGNSPLPSPSPRGAGGGPEWGAAARPGETSRTEIIPRPTVLEPEALAGKSASGSPASPVSGQALEQPKEAAAPPPSPPSSGSLKTAIRVLVAVALVAFVLGRGVFQVQKPGSRPLVVGFLPDRRVTTERLHTLEPVARMLERVTGRKVEPFVGLSYAENVEAFVQGRVDIAQFGGVTYVLATQRLPGAVPMMQRDVDRRFHTLFLVTPKSGIEKLEDLRGKTFAFVDPLSTSGYLVPVIQLMEAGIEPRRDPEKGFANVVFTHGHDSSLEELVAGRVDGAAIEERVHDQALYLGRLDRTQVKIIGTSKPFPDDAWLASPDLDAATRDAVVKAFLSLTPTRSEDAQVLSALEAKRYLALEDADYDDLRAKVKLLQAKGLLENP